MSDELQKSTFDRGRSRRQFMLYGAATILVLAALPANAQENQLGAAVYVRRDTDHTTVVSPLAHATHRFGESTTIAASYTADIWTSASIDIRASASVRPVSEQRNELNVSLGQVISDLTLTGAYRFSTEPDYTSHGGSLDAALHVCRQGCDAGFAAARVCRHGRSGW